MARYDILSSFRLQNPNSERYLSYSFWYFSFSWRLWTIYSFFALFAIQSSESPSVLLLHSLFQGLYFVALASLTLHYSDDAALVGWWWWQQSHKGEGWGMRRIWRRKRGKGVKNGINTWIRVPTWRGKGKRFSSLSKDFWGKDARKSVYRITYKKSIVLEFVVSETAANFCETNENPFHHSFLSFQR